MRQRRLVVGSSRSFSEDGVKQLLMQYRGRRYAAVHPEFEFKPGFLYSRVRAISARINQNYDGWPSKELQKSYRSFIGKPCFVNHKNFNPKKARGKVIAARYVEAGDDRYIETIMEIDAQRFPKLASEIKSGGLDSVSMGVEAGFTICSYCHHKAVDEPEFCDHVKFHKGQVLSRRNRKTGKKEDVLVFEHCYKLGFFELSYVFDPADETSVVSRVIAAHNRQAERPGGDWPPRDAWERAPHPESFDWGDPHAPDWHDDHKRYLTVKQYMDHRHSAVEDAPPPDEIIEGQMPDAIMPTAKRRRRAHPQHMMTPIRHSLDDRDRDDEEDEEGEPTLHHVMARRRRYSYGETEAPEQVDTLRNDDEDDTDDFHHYVDTPKELRAPNMDQTQRLDREQEEQGLDKDRRVEDVEDFGGTPLHRAHRRRHAVSAEKGHKKPYGNTTYADPGYRGRARYPINDREHVEAAEHYFSEPRNRDKYGPSERHEIQDRIDNAASRVGNRKRGGKAMARRRYPDARTARRFYADDDDALLDEAIHDLEGAEHDDSDDFSDDPGSDAGGTDDDYSDDFDDDDDSDDDDDGHFDDDDDDDEHFDDDDDDFDDDDDGHAGGGNPFVGAGGPLGGGLPIQGYRRPSLASRGRVAARGRLRHYAEDNSGDVDGGPYHVDDNDQGVQEDEFISETPGGTEDAGIPSVGEAPINNSGDHVKDARRHRRAKAIAQEAARRAYARALYAEDDGLPDPPQQASSGVEFGDVVDPSIDSTGADGLRGDNFEEVGLDGGSESEIHPDDFGGGHEASRRAFAAFDSWLRQTTGRTASRHSSSFIRRCAARYCHASGVRVEALFPTLGVVLREARKSEQRSAMRKRADDKLDLAAPQNRINVEQPVADTTDARAQASQFDLNEFGQNAGDNLADPVMSSDSQIWAPGERPTKNANRRADGITAVRYAEAYISAGLAPNTPEEKWRIAGLAQTMRLGTIRDRTRLLDAVNQVGRANTRRKSARVRNNLPPGVGGRQMTATRTAAINDVSTDAALFFKG